MKKYHFLFLFLLVSFFSCQKDQENPSKTQLISRNWQADEVAGSVAGTSTTVYKKGAANNQADYTKLRFNFSQDGNITVISQTGQIERLKWRFVKNETAVEIIEATESNTFEINTLSATKLDLQLDVLYNGTTVRTYFKMIPE